jgi:hypothetical protein
VPDPDYEPQLLASDTPELSPPAKGCAFQRRCPYSLGEICEQETPPWQSPASATGHQIRCHIPIEELDRMTRGRDLNHVNGNQAVEIDPQMMMPASSEVEVSSPEAKDNR